MMHHNTAVGLKRLSLRSSLETLARIEMKVDVALRTSASIAIRHFDAYFNMAPTNAGANDPRQEKIRRDYFDYCGIASGITDKPGSSSSGSEIVNEPNPARCVLTGRSGELQLTHLVPASA
jgi:hypothetical protein